MSSTARNTQVQATTMFSLLLKIVVSAQIHSAEISSHGLKNEVVELGSLFQRESNQQQQPSPTHHNLQYDTTHTYIRANTHSCNANFTTNAGSASCLTAGEQNQWLQSTTQPNSACTYTHMQKCSRYSSKDPSELFGHD